MKKIYLLFVVLLFTQCQNSGNKPTEQQKQITAKLVGNLPKTLNDTLQILQKVIDLPKLQQYYHSNLPERVPLVVEKNNYVPTEFLLKKFDQPVVFVDKTAIVSQLRKAYFKITKLDIDANQQQATIKFSYPIEGIGGQASLTNSQGTWKIVKSSLYEQ